MSGHLKIIVDGRVRFDGVVDRCDVLTRMPSDWRWGKVKVEVCAEGPVPPPVDRPSDALRVASESIAAAAVAARSAGDLAWLNPLLQNTADTGYRVITGRHLGVAFAHVVFGGGSVPRRTFLGFTRRQADRRAGRWLAFADPDELV